MLILALTLAAPMPHDPIDFRALDAAIERCERATVLPLFAAEAQRRSTFLTMVYEEQLAISAERLNVAAKRRSLREAGPQPPAVVPAPMVPAESDQQLALQQLALDDRQRALDDRRRVEALRQDAIDVKRAYFLSRCPSGKKSD